MVKIVCEPQKNLRVVLGIPENQVALPMNEPSNTLATRLQT